MHVSVLDGLSVGRAHIEAIWEEITMRLWILGALAILGSLAFSHNLHASPLGAAGGLVGVDMPINVEKAQYYNRGVYAPRVNQLNTRRLRGATVAPIKPHCMRIHARCTVRVGNRCMKWVCVRTE